MKQLLFQIANVNVYQNDDGSIEWTAKLAVDVDGSGPSHGDPDYQPDTSLHLNGSPLNADEDCYIVVPPAIRDAVPEVVLGCQAYVMHTRNAHETDAVTGDIGPHKKIGEASYKVAQRMGLNPSPISGGTDEHIILYRIWPGRAAVVDGKQYQLQPS